MCHPTRQWKIFWQIFPLLNVAQKYSKGRATSLLHHRTIHLLWAFDVVLSTESAVRDANKILKLWEMWEVFIGVKTFLYFMHIFRLCRWARKIDANVNEDHKVYSNFFFFFFAAINIVIVSVCRRVDSDVNDTFQFCHFHANNFYIHVTCIRIDQFYSLKTWKYCHFRAESWNIFFITHSSHCRFARFRLHGWWPSSTLQWTCSFEFPFSQSWMIEVK